MRKKLLMNKKNISTFKLYSKAFKDEQKIPEIYSSTDRGKNISPPLYWENVPDKTESFVLIQEDIDIPRLFSPFSGKITHWIIYNIPSDKKELKEGIPRQKYLKDGSVQTKNIYMQNGYLGPNPIWGTHRYIFTIYALDIVISSKKTKNKNALLKNMKDHVLAKAEIVGIYSK